MKKMKWLSIPLVLLLMVLAGCQSVGGLDISQGLINNMKVKSAESRQTLSVKVVPREGNISAKDKKMIELINSISLTVDEAKMENESTLSAKGTIGVDGRKLPYAVAMDKKGMTLSFEGMNKPLYLPMDNAEMKKVMPGFDPERYTQQVMDLTTQAAGFLVKHAPNPNTISVESVTDTVYGQSLELKKLHAEIRGDELTSLLKPFLQNVAKDKEGMKQLLNSGYELVYSIMGSMPDKDTAEAMKELNKNKDMIINMAVEEASKALNKFVADYDQNVAKMFKEVPELKTVLGKDTVFKTDMFFDNSGQLRKSNVDLTIALPDVDDLPIKSIGISSNAEMWNVNGRVQADPVDLSGGVINVEDQELTPGVMLRNINPKSDLYQMLKDMNVTAKEVNIVPNGNYEVITKDGTTMVPLRQLAADFDADLKVNAASKSFTVTDDITGTTIVLTKGSKQALVGGKAVALATPIYVDQKGTTFVPLKFMAEALGASVHQEKGGSFTLNRK